MIRFGPRGYLISENYFIQTEGTTALIFSFGGRHIIQSAGLDYGLVIPIIVWQSGSYFNASPQVGQNLYPASWSNSCPFEHVTTCAST